MANPTDHHAKLIIGDLVLTIARQAAEIDALRQQLAAAPPPAPPTGPQP
jgi:hypothetical protein